MHLALRLMILVFSVCVGSGIWMDGAARAQGVTWVQLAARPNLTQMENQARQYEQSLGGITGHALRSGWFALAIGPQDRAASETLLRELSRIAAIPSDAFISDGSGYGAQVWPRAGETSPPVAGLSALTVNPAQPTLPAVQQSPGNLPDETPRQARSAEAALSLEDRRELQRALRWFNVYDGSIDGQIGPGTRRSMAAWQAQNGHAETGILTTRQRAAMLKQQDSERAELGLEQVIEDRAGITLDLPIGLVQFDRYDAPFVHYAERDGSGVQVLLISQPGDLAMLQGLYDILQTLEIVPLNGYRKMERNSFVLMGSNDDVQSYTYAALNNGEIKGFTLLWPPGDLARRDRVMNQMRASFSPQSGTVLTPQDGPGNGPGALDEVAGLSIRQPERSGAGFFVEDQGYVLTTSWLVDGCGRISGEDDVGFEIVSEDRDLGLSLLRPLAPLAPLAVARLSATLPALRSEIAVGGFPYGGRLATATLTYGQFEEAADLAGDTRRSRLTLLTEPGDLGGPVLTPSGEVVGLLLGEAKSAGRVLPAEVRLSLNSATLLKFLRDAGRPIPAQEALEDQSPEGLYQVTRDMTVLLSCWK